MNHLSSCDDTRNMSIVTELNNALVERNIVECGHIAVADGKIVFSGSEYLLKKQIVGNGQFELHPECVCGRYKGEQGSYQLRWILPQTLPSANGLTVKYRLKGWQSIRYLAVGHSAEEGFRHIKIANPSQDEWVTFSVGYNDLVFGLKNNWQYPDADTISDVCLYISGTPVANSAHIEVQWVSTWLENVPDGVSLQDSDHLPNRELKDAIKKYFMRCNPNIEQQVTAFLTNGDIPMTGDVMLPWKYNQPQPQALPESGTYRYLWHAMQPAISMLVHYTDTGELGSLCAARDFMVDWLERSFFNPDPDLKYTWYDHGAAERLMAFLFMYEIGVEHQFDKRFMSRLRYGIYHHSQLLESEAFYAGHQPTRYHNHAWFQDMALIAVACAFPQYQASERWLHRAVERLTDQLNTLIVRDSGYAIFVENSIGYHHGIQRLVEFAGELVALSGGHSEIHKIAEELNAWSKFLLYPDGRCPSQGDTFRCPNLSEPDKVVRGRPYQQVQATLLPDAGYGIVKGNHDNVPFMMCLFATSLCKTHKHEDNLSMTLFFDGIEWLLDPSFYSHEYTQTIPAYLRSAQAHNTVWLPGVNYSTEPGHAQLDGSIAESEFNFSGKHWAYEQTIIERQISGSLNRLSLSVNDRIVSERRSDVDSARLVLHFGEGVAVEVISDGVLLNHPASRHRLKIVLPMVEAQVIFGAGEEERISVAGASFMLSQDTYSLMFTLSSEGAVDWQVQVAE